MPAPLLLADDSPHARRMGTEYLTGLGFAVEAVGDAAAARAVLAARTPALVIVDAALPGVEGEALGGMALCREIKQHPRWQAIPVLVLLGALARVAPEALAAADGVLRKPLSSAGLERSLARWLGRLPEAPVPVPENRDTEELSPEQMLVRAVHDAVFGA